MPSPASSVGLASLPAGGDLYFPGDQALTAIDPGEITPGGYATEAGTHSDATNLQTSSLMFPEGFTGEGAAIANVSESPTGRGHWSEVLNFHGSPAPWILIGLLLVFGLMHLEAKGKLGSARAGLEV